MVPVGGCGGIQVDANGGISTITVEGSGAGYQFPPAAVYRVFTWLWGNNHC